MTPSSESPSRDDALPLHVETLGCRVNRYESDGLHQSLLSTGRFISPDKEHPPRIVLINSCTVTDQADARNRYAIRRLKRLYPGALIVVTGCYAQTDRAALEALDGVDLVVGNDHKSELPALLSRWFDGSVATSRREALRESQSSIQPLPEGRSFRIHNPFDYGRVLPVGHTRAYLKIQDGCDRRCSYCKVPAARGRGISRMRREILDHLKALRDAGVPEVVLTGINLGAWRDGEGGHRDPSGRNRASQGAGHGKGRGDLISLLEEMLEVEGDFRIRISSIEPNDVTEELAELSRHPRFCNFLHVPVQSGSAAVLRRMKRPATKKMLLDRMEMALRINPDLFLGTDVMVGFPGETEEEFQETLSLCERIGFANIHVFAYSPRKGTPAALMEGRVAPDVARRRSKAVEQLASQRWEIYATRFVGRELEAVVEREASPGRSGSALTDNFLRLRWKEEPDGTPISPPRRGELRRFRVQGIGDGIVEGSPVQGRPGPGEGA